MTFLLDSPNLTAPFPRPNTARVTRGDASNSCNFVPAISLDNVTGMEWVEMEGGGATQRAREEESHWAEIAV